MKILITGASGLIGSKLNFILGKRFDIIATNRTGNNGMVKMDITDKDNVFSVIKKSKPNFIIHSAVLNNVDYCELHNEEAWKTNVEGTRNVAQAAANNGIKLVYISTEYVFDGKNGPYSETDNPNPLGYYAKTKYEGEKITSSICKKWIITRTTVPYGYDTRINNFALWLINELKNNRPVRIVNDQYSSPTLTDNFSDIMGKLIEKNKEGIYHISGPDVINRYDFSLKIAEIFNLNKKLIKPVATKELCQKSPRPLKAGLKVDKIINELDIKPIGIKEGLLELKSQINN